MQKRIEISIVIPAFNEEKYIGRLLKDLQKQSFKNFEIIVADGGSTDNTRKIASKFSKVRIVVEKRKGIGIGRNAGAHAARGKIIVFIDADTTASENLLRNYDAAFKEKDIVAATGPIFPLEKTSRRMELGFKLVSVLFVKSSILIGKPSIIGSNFAIRKNIFEKIGGFDEKFMTYEDYDLSLRIRKTGRIEYLNDAIVYTSIRRVKKWGMLTFFFYHTGNILRYNLLKKPLEKYDPIR
ncbi:MAG: glycosyltransferase [Candidatus Micrarchaeales archaeon]|jgi:glycosyltransferase involved in cell wall biosynthesis